MPIAHPNQTYPFRHHRHSLAHAPALPALASNRLISFAASSIVGVFLPIFLYEFFNLSITAVLLWYAINFAVKFPFQVWAAQIFSRTGLIASMVFGTLGIMLFYWTFYLIDAGSALDPYLLMAIGIAGLTIVSCFYWSPFHIDYAQFGPKEARGAYLARLYALQQLIQVIAPVLAGWVIVTYGFRLNFFLGLVLAGASIVPLFFLPAFKVKYEFGFWESFKKLFGKRFRPMSLSMMAYGAENIVGVVVWPIFLYAIFQGQYLEIGAFAAIIVVIGLALELLVGRETDRFSASKLLKYGTGIYALGWVWKGLVETVAGVFAASTFHNVGAILLRTPMDTLMYEQAADSGHYIDEYTVLREIALGIGRVLMLLFLIAVTSVFSIGASFFVAAVVSLGINWLVDYQAGE
ncbi:MAG TPA: MFS transporter [Patescibacteria group bacterium]|nr:MFS transporter [Patescibacteria group bacterium]